VVDVIIWTGKGYLVAVFVFGCSLVANLAANAVSGDEVFWEQHRWPFAVSLIASGALSSIVGNVLRRKGTRTLIDPQTNEEVLLERSHHSLFFIRMHHWGPILVTTAIGLLLWEALQ
jgi:hypothetical protein